jgi:non-ribosomal peptide synthetase-like protein
MTGDSSLIAWYLRALGWKLTPFVQTGSNFGNEVKHETPYLSRIGGGTVCASDISMVNASYSASSFRLTRASIGEQNFLGNQIVYPYQGRTGNDCLLATKVLVPVDGPVRHGVGLLGSPAFEIPRSVSRDTSFHHLASGENLRRGLRAKNRHNLATLFWLLATRWFFLSVSTIAALFIVDHAFNPFATLAMQTSLLIFGAVSTSVIERAATGFRGSVPLYCSIYSKEFWQVERFFKLQASTAIHRMAAGTPFKPLLYRMVGVKVGRRLFDDGSGMSEKTMVTIGDDVTLGVGSFIQCHTQEDYAFKSERIRIGSGCTVGTAAMVYYGTTMGNGSVLSPDSFLMKGEEIPPGAHWGGNPAVALTERGAGPPAGSWSAGSPPRRRHEAHHRNRTPADSLPDPEAGTDPERLSERKDTINARIHA